MYNLLGLRHAEKKDLLSRENMKYEKQVNNNSMREKAGVRMSEGKGGRAGGL